MKHPYKLNTYLPNIGKITAIMPLSDGQYRYILWDKQTNMYFNFGQDELDDLLKFALEDGSYYLHQYWSDRDWSQYDDKTGVTL